MIGHPYGADRFPSSAKHRIAVALFGGGLASFIAFHVILGLYSERPGWTIWPTFAEHILNPPVYMDAEDLTILASFLTLAVVISASPFMAGVFLKSRLAWSLATLMSGISTAVIWLWLLVQKGPDRLGPGGWCLLMAPALNLAGLLVIRGLKTAAAGSRKGPRL